LIFKCQSFALYLCWHRFTTMPRLIRTSEGWSNSVSLKKCTHADQISVPERFLVLQSTLSRLRHRMLTTGSLNNQFRSGSARVATRHQDQETPLLHLRNCFQVAVKTTFHFWTHNNAWISPKMVKEGGSYSAQAVQRFVIDAQP
jgi:hypothetical protein